MGNLMTAPVATVLAGENVKVEAKFKRRWVAPWSRPLSAMRVVGNPVGNCAGARRGVELVEAGRGV